MKERKTNWMKIGIFSAIFLLLVFGIFFGIRSMKLTEINKNLPIITGKAVANTPGSSYTWYYDGIITTLSDRNYNSKCISGMQSIDDNLIILSKQSDSEILLTANGKLSNSQEQDYINGFKDGVALMIANVEGGAYICDLTNNIFIDQYYKPKSYMLFTESSLREINVYNDEISTQGYLAGLKASRMVVYMRAETYY